MIATPKFLVLRDSECRELLSAHHVGRLAFQSGGVVDIQPLGYVHQGNWLIMRSAWGSKLEALEGNPFVAFEVDEATGPFDWRSVVVQGTIYELPPDGGDVERNEFTKAVAALREVMPEALASDDPVPERNIVYGLRIDRMSGRMACVECDDGHEPVPAHESGARRRQSDGF